MGLVSDKAGRNTDLSPASTSSDGELISAEAEDFIQVLDACVLGDSVLVLCVPLLDVGLDFCQMLHVQSSLEMLLAVSSIMQAIQ